jgi:isopentenyl diphosphate isomerase/L-lactate dehydrogenase-like FMN-dependent dehydrogenase
MVHPDDLAALARVSLIPRALHAVFEPNLSVELLGRLWPSPLLRSATTHAEADTDTLTLVPAAHVSSANHGRLPLVPPGKMGEVMPEVRRLAALGVPAVALDLRPLHASEPFGLMDWRPRSRDDLAEIMAAAGRPVWLLGVASAEDASAAADAGIDAIVVDGALGVHLGGPATAEVLPEVVDAVAGMLRVLAGGAVGGGLDVLRLLALGADAVVVGGDRSTSALLAELTYGMRLSGCGNLSEVGYDIVFAPAFGEP